MTPSIPQSHPSIAEIRKLFARRSVWETWLEIEAALAETQAELGMIPAPAAAEIRSKANFSAIDEAALAADIERTRAPIVSLVRALARACNGDAGGYVHWGATTQNVIQTGRTLLMRRVHGAFMARFSEILLRFADLAEDHAGTVTIARTNFRHALPITFGFKVAGWIEEWLRHGDRFAEAAPRVFCAQWGGAVGAMHAAGADGPELNRRLAARLGLGSFAVPSRAALDYFAEYVVLFGLFSATCSKIARDLYAMMADEVGEIVEDLGDDVVGSSTMPHKSNPKVAVHVIALAARLRAQVPLALEAMQPAYEGDAANNQMISALIDEACPLAYELITKMDELLGCIRVQSGQMRHNLDLSGDFMTSENVMMTLAPEIGRTRAHDLVHHAVVDAKKRSTSLAEALLTDGVMPEAISESMIHEALDPARYTGLSEELARQMAATARAAARALNARASALDR